MFYDLRSGLPVVTTMAHVSLDVQTGKHDAWASGNAQGSAVFGPEKCFS